MRREITAFCNNGAFLRRFRAFSQHCVGHFFDIALPQHDLVMRWGIFPSTASSRLSDEEEVKCETNIYSLIASYTLFYDN